MKKMFALLLALVLALSCLTACGASSGSDLAYIQKKGTMIVGITEYEPMDFKDADGNWTGFDAELAEMVCKELGVKCEFFVLADWGKKFYELESKNIDCIWNGMTITDDLKQNIAISDPYVKNMQVAVIKSANADKYTDVASLASASLVAEAGSAGQSVIEDEANGLSGASLTTVAKQTDALLEVASGASDAAILDWTLAKSMIGEGTDFADLVMIDGLELSVEEYGIGFRKDSDLCDKVNEIMGELIADGTLPALADKYGLGLAE